MSELTRRTLLSGAAAITATALSPLGHRSAEAATPLTGKQAPGFYRYKIGSYEITVVTDGARGIPLTDAYMTNVKKEDVAKALAAAYLPTDKVTHHYAPIVVNTGASLVLIDTGSGAKAYTGTKGQVGQLPYNLAAAGIDPKQIDIVVISHFHGDHVNGLITADNKALYPNAEIKVPALEWKFWMDDGEMSRASPGRMANLFKDNRHVFDSLNRKVTQYEWNKEVVPGVTALATVGHTPGHTSYVIASGASTLYVQSDVTNNPDLFVRNPGFHGAFDQDPVQAEATRRKVYDMLAVDRLLVQGFHYPFPGLGHVEKDGSAYRVIPAPWNPTI